MVSSDQDKQRKEATLKAHSILLRLDRGDFNGNVTFCFKRGEGLRAYKIEEVGQIDRDPMTF